MAGNTSTLGESIVMNERIVARVAYVHATATPRAPARAKCAHVGNGTRYARSCEASAVPSNADQAGERDVAAAGPHRRQQGPWQHEQQRQSDRDQGNEQDQVQRLGAVRDEELAVALEDVVQRLGDGEGPEGEQVRRRERDLADASSP